MYKIDFLKDIFNDKKNLASIIIIIILLIICYISIKKNDNKDNDNFSIPQLNGSYSGGSSPPPQQLLLGPYSVGPPVSMINNIQTPTTTKTPTTTFKTPTTTKTPLATTNILSKTLESSYNIMNTSRFTALDNQDRINSLDKRLQKIKIDLAMNDKSNKKNLQSKLTFY